MRNVSTPAERKVIVWFFGVAFLAATLFIAWSWFNRRQECIASCEAKGAPGGSLQMNAGGRFNLGTHCVCKK